MKRSEMIEILQQFIKVDWGVEVNKNQINHLLDEIETLGMWPPINEDLYHYMDNGARKEINAGTKYFKWEEE